MARIGYMASNTFLDKLKAVKDSLVLTAQMLMLPGESYYEADPRYAKRNDLLRESNELARRQVELLEQIAKKQEEESK